MVHFGKRQQEIIDAMKTGVSQSYASNYTTLAAWETTYLIVKGQRTPVPKQSVYRLIDRAVLTAVGEMPRANCFEDPKPRKCELRLKE